MTGAQFSKSHTAALFFVTVPLNMEFLHLPRIWTELHAQRRWDPRSCKAGED
jgi:hypothetical protein